VVVDPREDPVPTSGLQEEGITNQEITSNVEDTVEQDTGLIAAQEPADQEVSSMAAMSTLSADNPEPFKEDKKEGDAPNQNTHDVSDPQNGLSTATPNAL
jgi:hypothetical protein